MSEFVLWCPPRVSDLSPRKRCQQTQGGDRAPSLFSVRGLERPGPRGCSEKPPLAPTPGSSPRCPAASLGARGWALGTRSHCQSHTYAELRPPASVLPEPLTGKFCFYAPSYAPRLSRATSKPTTSSTAPPRPPRGILGGGQAAPTRPRGHARTPPLPPTRRAARWET